MAPEPEKTYQWEQCPITIAIHLSPVVPGETDRSVCIGGALIPRCTPVKIHAIGTALQSLIDAPAIANPAIALSWQLRAQQLSPDDSIHYCVHHCRMIQQAIDSGTLWCQRTDAALIQLKRAKAVPSKTPVQGV
jgi:hypothetical protein